jgi:hypothetical protein
MTFSKVIYLDRGTFEVSALVSAEIIVNENSLFELSNFRADEILRPAEVEMAKEELIDRARAFPEAGTVDE